METTPPILKKELTRAQAWAYLCINLFLWPGFGMVLAKKKIGYAQAAASGLTGGGMILAMLWFFVIWFKDLDMKRPPLHSAPVLFGLICVALFALCWIWSLVTSLQLLSETPNPGPGPR